MGCAALAAVPDGVQGTNKREEEKKLQAGLPGPKIHSASKKLLLRACSGSLKLMSCGCGVSAGQVQAVA